MQQETEYALVKLLKEMVNYKQNKYYSLLHPPKD